MPLTFDKLAPNYLSTLFMNDPNFFVCNMFNALNVSIKSILDFSIWYTQKINFMIVGVLGSCVKWVLLLNKYYKRRVLTHE